MKSCPSCGASEKQREFIGAFCVDCYAKKRGDELISAPKKIELDTCPVCKCLRQGLNWVDFDGDYESVLVQKLKSPYPIVEAKARFVENRVFFNAVVEIEGKRIPAYVETRFDLTKKMCQDCGRRSGGYHEAIIQLRGNPTRISQLAQALLRELEEITFVTKVIEKKEGVDLQVGSKRAAIDVMSKRHFETTTSNKLVGEKNGRQLFRRTICVRL